MASLQFPQDAVRNLNISGPKFYDHQQKSRNSKPIMFDQKVDIGKVNPSQRRVRR